MHAIASRLTSALCALTFFVVWAATYPTVGEARNPSKSCTLDGQTSMAFGIYDPMRNGALEMQGRVSYRCGNGNGNGNANGRSNGNGNGNGHLTVQISLSSGSAGNFNRHMNGPPGEQLRYNLYLDSSRTTVWGDGTGGTRVYSDKAQPNGQMVTVPVFGRIYGAQDVGAGNYADSIIVTLDF